MHRYCPQGNWQRIREKEDAPPAESKCCADPAHQGPAFRATYLRRQGSVPVQCRKRQKLLKPTQTGESRRSQETGLIEAPTHQSGKPYRDQKANSLKSPAKNIAELLNPHKLYGNPTAVRADTRRIASKIAGDSK